MKHIVEPSSSPRLFAGADGTGRSHRGTQPADCQAKLEKSYGAPRSPTRSPAPLPCWALGKFGGRELGYASDIEVLFVYGGAGAPMGKQGIENSEYFERLAQELLQWIEAKQEGIFRLDVRLRPHGGKGSLANAFEEICRYYSQTGLTASIERQDLIKRSVCAPVDGTSGLPRRSSGKP